MRQPLAFAEQRHAPAIAFKSSMLIAYLNDNDFTAPEIDLMQHYAEHIVIERRTAA